MKKKLFVLIFALISAFALVSCAESVEESGGTDTGTESVGYKVAFVTDDFVTVTVYKTQDLTTGGEVTDTAYSRDSSTGELTVDGTGQVNFVLSFSDGYELSDIVIEGTYKNLKGSSDTGVENGYRITKIESELKVTVTSAESSETSETQESVTTYSLQSQYNGNSLTLDATASVGEFTAEVKDGVLIIKSDSLLEITLSGAYAGGVQIETDENSDLTVNLSAATLYATTTAPALYIVSANNADVSAKSGTENFIYDERDSDQDIEAALYCLCDLTLKGKGSLTVYSENNNGIHTKDDLSIKNLTLNVTCTDNALKGNDSVTIESGVITLVSTEGDGIKTKNSEIKYNSDGSVKKIQGTITISGGTVNVYAASDGIDASYNVEISGSPVINVYTTKTYAGNKVSTAVTNSEDYFYIRYTDTTYNYSIYFYNSQTGGYVFKNPVSYDKVTASGGNGGFGGRQPMGSSSYYYYYAVEKPEGTYDTMAIYAYTSSQTQGQSDNYYAKSDAFSINSARDTVAITISSSKINASWTTYSSDDTPSCKGIKADNEIYISGGTIEIYSYDDGIHANNDVVLGDEDDASDDYYGKGNIYISGGVIEITTKDDGIHADQDLCISDESDVTIKTAYEGLEANRIYIKGGTVYAYATDDALNAALCNGAYTPSVEISGGIVDLAVGSGDTDTLDCNGNVTISGGTVILKNPQSSGTSMAGGTMDIDGKLTVTGGNVISIGCWCNEVSMTSQASSSSAILSKGDYTIKDSSGNVIAEFTLSTSYKGYKIYCYGKSGTFTLYNGTTKILSF